MASAEDLSSGAAELGAAGDGDAAGEDPAEALARFRAEREQKRRRGMLIVVCAGGSLVICASTVGELAANTFGSTTARAVTVTFVLYGMGLVYLAPFDFDREFSVVSTHKVSLELALLITWHWLETTNAIGCECTARSAPAIARSADADLRCLQTAQNTAISCASRAGCSCSHSSPACPLR